MEREGEREREGKGGREIGVERKTVRGREGWKERVKGREREREGEE